MHQSIPAPSKHHFGPTVAATNAKKIKKITAHQTTGGLNSASLRFAPHLDA
jgi:hypothetical protein